MSFTELWAVRGLVVLLAFLLAAGVAAAQGAGVRLGPNLIRNGSFEYVHADGAVAGWTVQWAWQHSPNEASATAETAYHGDRSLYTVVRSTNVPQGWGGRAYQDVPVADGATYQVSVAVKMRNWRSQATTEGVGVSVLWQFANGTWSESTVVTEELFAGDFDWRVLTARIAPPPGAVYLRLALWANAGTGEIWWDDVQLREVLTSAEPAAPAEDDAIALAAQLERALETSLTAALARIAEVDWKEIRALYDEAAGAIAAFRSTPTPHHEAAAQQAVHELRLALLGSRVAETRAYWIDDQALRTLRGRRDVAALLDTLHALGVNTIYPNVYFDSQTIYPSSVAGQSAAFYAWTEDPLQVLIEEAHARGMEVHAWYVVFAASHDVASMPSLVRRAGWLARDRGNGIFGEAQIIWYDPAHPQVQEFLLSLFREGLERYPLDGIHLDYIRYDAILKYGPATVEGFHAATGLDATALRPGSAEDQAFRKYTQNVITDFVAKVKALRDEVRPEAFLSAAVAAPYSWAINTRAQDWPEWARLGLVDYLVPMVYTADTAEFVAILDESLRLIGGHVPVEVGVASYALRLDQFGDQINAVRERDTLGSALFAAVHLQQIPSIGRELAAGVFRRPAVSRRAGERAAAVFLEDLVTRLRDQAALFTPEGPQAEALRRLADAVAKDPEQALRTLDVYALPEVSREAVRSQLVYALRLRQARARRAAAVPAATPAGRLSLALENAPLMTVTEPHVTVAGRVYGYEPGASVRVTVHGREAAVTGDGSFSALIPLEPGVNFIDVRASVAGQEGRRDAFTHRIVFYKQPRPEGRQEVFLWVEQGPNARRFQTSEDVYNTLLAAKEAGITAVILDVKGIEGYAAYKKNDLTGRPYVSAITAPTRRGASPDLDLLEEFVRHGHELGLAVFASLNAFAEGSIAHGAFALLDQHLDWEEVVYRPEDGGKLLRLRESAYGRSGASVAFVNPAHTEVRAFELRSFEEVIKNYDVDGIIVDRGRYDNIFADFSELSRAQFEAYLARRGKVLRNWPDDVFTYAGETRVPGPLWYDWLTYRAFVIRSFIAELRALVDTYNARDGRNVQLAAYVGSWYETMYLHGINWASPNFVDDPRLQLPEPDLYTDEYRAASYLADLDFLLIGTYQRTAEEVRRYIALANIVTGGEIPIYAGVALSNVGYPPLLREVFQAGLAYADGLMIFDLSQANFQLIKASLAGEAYVKDYQLGVSNPRDPDHFIEAHFLNVNRNEDNIIVYTESFGPSTNTSMWGVEVVVDASGRVLYVVNKTQAMFWTWTGVQQNNSPIPQGGFVISAEDPSGQRTNRQLIANAYRAGDQVRAALLKGLHVYDGLTTPAERLTVTGSVEVIGPGTAEVYVRGEPVSLDASGMFTVDVPLDVGPNAIDVAVRVDGLLTNRKTVTVVRVDG